MIYGYARVSTKRQLDGNGLEAQRQQLAEAGCGEVVVEQFTGSTMHRPKWDRLFKRLQPGDTLVACKLDRIARTTEEGLSSVRELMERGVSVRILNMGTIDDTPMGRLVLTVMLAFAEFERDLIVERMAEGKRVAMQQPGYQNGRPEKDYDQERFLEAVRLSDEGKVLQQEAADMCGMPLRTYQRRKSKLKRLAS